MKKFASIVIALAFVMGTIGSANAQDPNCVYDVVGITDLTPPYSFSPDGWVTFNRTNWYEDDVYACYYTYLYPQYYQYFSACDFDGDGSVDFQTEVLPIYSFVIQHPWPTAAATHAYQCQTGGGYQCPAGMPAFYDPSGSDLEWLANGVCAEYYAGSSTLACSQAQHNVFLNNINTILNDPDYEFTNAVLDGVNGGLQTYSRPPDKLLCGTGEVGVNFPAGFFDDIAECWHGDLDPGSSFVLSFDWNVNVYAAFDAYEAYIQETYPSGYCEIDVLAGAPTGFHASDAGGGWTAWTVRSTANCDFYGCRCDATLTGWTDPAGVFFESSLVNDSIFYIYQGLACEDDRFIF